MQFALFYEIPVPRPWTPRAEYQAYQNTLEQAVFDEQMGLRAFWTVEHHVLEEFSHCSNPELGTYEYLTGAQQIVEGGLHEKLTFELLNQMN